MIDGLLTAFVLGLIGGAIPGPLITSIFTEILQSGLLRGFRLVFLGMIVETFVASACLIGLASLNLPEALFRLISVIGAGILFWLALAIWKIKKIDSKQRVHFSKRKIAAMILANGALWMFWITVCVPKAILLNKEVSWRNFVFNRC